MLEDPAAEAPEYVHQRTISPEDAPDKATVITIDFVAGDPVAIDGEALSPAALLARLNRLGHDNGIGRLDLVESRFVGMKSRGVYETPGGTILLAAHRGIESITLDGGAMHLKDELMPRYASLIYNGFWFAPERAMLQALIDQSQEHVSGRVTIKLYKGNATVIGRESPNSLYSQDLVTFEEDSGGYDQRDADGFIRLNALRLRIAAERELRLIRPEAQTWKVSGGPSRNRTGVQGFAVLCVTTPPSGRGVAMSPTSRPGSSIDRLSNSTDGGWRGGKLPVRAALRRRLRLRSGQACIQGVLAAYNSYDGSASHTRLRGRPAGDDREPVAAGGGDRCPRARGDGRGSA